MRNTEGRSGPHDDPAGGPSMGQLGPLSGDGPAAAITAQKTRAAAAPAGQSSFVAPAIAFAVGLAIVLIPFWPSWRLLAQAWADSETYSHGFAVVPVALWLVWRQRVRLARLSPSPSLLGVPVLVTGIVLWVLGELSEVNVARYLGIVTMIPGLVTACFGVAVTRVIAFPLAFLYFMVPFGEGLVPWLMDRTADATVAALQFTGIPVYREGLFFTLPSGRWSVVEACSGLRYVIAAFVLSTLFAHLNFRRAWKGIIFVAIALALSVVANWMRAYLIVMIGHLSDMRYGTGNDHVVYGWIFFGLVMLAIFWSAMRYADADAPAAVSSGPDAATEPRSSIDVHGRAVAAQGRATWRLSAAIAGLLVVTFAAHAAVDAARDVVARSDAVRVLTQALEPFEAAPIDIEPVYAGSTVAVNGRVAGDDVPMQVYVAYFARQHDTGEMIRWGNQVLRLDDKWWGTYAQRVLAVEGEGGGFDVRERLVRQGADSRLVWSWYTVAGRSTASERSAKLLTLRAMLTGNGDHSTVAVLIAPVGTDRARAAEALRRRALQLDAAARSLTAAGRR